MALFEGALASSRPFIVVEIQAAGGQMCEAAKVSRLQGLALVDTGAEMSAATQRAAEQLGMVTNDTADVATATNRTDLPAYCIRLDVQFNRPSECRMLDSSVRVFEDQTPWAPQMTGLEVVAIIGMDLLALCSLRLDGPNDRFELHL